MNYILKMKNKSLLLSAYIYFFISALLILIFDIASWEFIKQISVLIPVFLSTNVLSEEYENRREGIILITNTPTYKLVISRYCVSFIMGQLILIPLFIIAWLKGIEPNIITKYSIVLIYSLFLSLLGLLVSNITKSTVAGFIVPAIYCLSQIIIGTAYLEKYIPVLITALNIELNEHIIVSNIYFMLFSIISLFLINVFYISKGEGIRRYVILTVLSISIIGGISAGIHYIAEYNKETVFHNVILDNPIYIIGAKDTNIANYLSNKKLKFISRDTITKDDINNRNVVIVSSKDSSLKNNAKELLKLNLIIKNNYIISKQNGVYNVSSYRILERNPLSKNNWLALIECTNTNDLDSIINTSRGNFLAVKNGKPMIKSNYSFDKFDFSNIINNSIILNSNCWLLKENSFSNLLYRKINKKDAGNISNLWMMINESLDGFYNNYEAASFLKVYFKENVKNNNEPNSIYISSTKSLETDSSYQIYTSICYEFLNKQIFKNVEDTTLKQRWIEYMTNIYIPTIILDKYKDAPLSMNAFTLQGMITSYKQQIKSINTEEDKADNSILSAKLLYTLNAKGKLKDFIKDISMANQKLSNSDLKKIYSKYAGKTSAESDFDSFK